MIPSDIIESIVNFGR